VFIEAKGLLGGVDVDPPNEPEKLNAVEPLPEPKANCDPPFWAGGLVGALVGGKLWDCPKLKPFVGGWDAAGVETVLGSSELNGPPKDALGEPDGEPARGRLRMSLILSIPLENALVMV
jgi:hypothetical protein